jgi:hypothetical protein
MEELITAADKFWVIYDSDNDNVVVGLLMESLDKDLHDSSNPDNIRISTNKIDSPDGDILYLHELQVDSNGLATRI